jgi:hypothetical protein
MRKVLSLVIVVATALALYHSAANAATTPAVEISDQVIQNSWVVVPKVVAAEPGWIVIHSGGEGNPAIGAAYVPAGESDNVSVRIDMEKATPTMSAMLHVDKGEAGKYEFPGADTPVMNDGKIVNVPFNTIGVDVDDQFVTAKKVTLGKVIAQEDGWIAIHSGAQGSPVIGSAPIKKGVNEDVEVPVDAAKATDRMTAMIHIDAGTKGKYEFPGADKPASLGNAISNEPFWTSDHVRVQSAPLGSDNTIVVPYVLAKADGWLAIHTTAKGNPVIGFAPVKAGLNEGVQVKLDDASTATETVLVMLHVDAGTKGKYEFPGADGPVKDKAGNVIAPPMLIGNGVLVHDQKVDDLKKSGMVLVDDVVAAQNGWIAIHSSAAGNPVIGSVFVPAGESHNVMVKIKPEGVTDTLLAMLHVDAGQPGVYEFPGPDGPVKDKAGNIIAPAIKTGGPKPAAPTKPAPTRAPTKPGPAATEGR